MNRNGIPLEDASLVYSETPLDAPKLHGAKAIEATWNFFMKENRIPGSLTLSFRESADDRKWGGYSFIFFKKCGQYELLCNGLGKFVMPETSVNLGQVMRPGDPKEQPVQRILSFHNENKKLRLKFLIPSADQMLLVGIEEAFN